nr:hypothetical protein [Syntrophus gentianae]
MAFVFDAPVSSVDFQELFRRRFVGLQAGDQVNGFASFFAGFEDFGMALNTGDLPAEGEIYIIIQTFLLQLIGLLCPLGSLTF